MYSPLWKITHENPSVLCTPPPFEKSPIKTRRFCASPPPLKNHPSQPIGFMYSPLWKITVFGGRLFRNGRLFRQIRLMSIKSTVDECVCSGISSRQCRHTSGASLRCHCVVGRKRQNIFAPFSWKCSKTLLMQEFLFNRNEKSFSVRMKNCTGITERPNSKNSAKELPGFIKEL